MNFEIDEIDSVENLGEVDSDFYDIGMEDTPHTFFANDILVHNSCFASALPVIQVKFPEIDTNDNDSMTKAILEVTNEVQDSVNAFYTPMAKHFFNLDKHQFFAKQEVIAKTGFWIKKKRYAQFIINKNGIACDELEIKGLDVVRTTFPVKFRIFMEKFLKDILYKIPKENIDADILKLKKDIVDFDISDIAKNTSVKFASENKKSNYNPKGRNPFNYVKGTPAQTKAALGYNDLLKLWNLDGHVSEIMNSQKIKWVYTKQNPFGVECIAMKADGTDPKEIMKFIDDYADRSAMFEKELKKKLLAFYDTLKWDFPSESDATIGEFFSF